MPPITRLLTIFRVAVRYRLDTFFSNGNAPLPIRLLAKTMGRLPEPKEPRGVRLRKALEDLGPIFIKFGQLLSTRPDLVPEDICRELDSLQDNVPPFAPDQFVAIVEAALGDNVDNLFLRFDRQPLASASVAQVHTAALPDGQEVVVKAIRPGIEKVIQQDIDLLFSLAKRVEKYSAEGRRLRPVDIVRDYRNTILDELNLQREGANAAILRRHFMDSPLLYVPSVHWPLTNERVLVMERIHGVPVTDIDKLSASHTDFKQLAERGVEIFFTQVFEHNFFHADMHPGNIFVDARNPASPRYIAVDCAIIGSLTDADQYYLARNLLAIFRRDYRQVAELHVLSGWVPKETPVNDFAAAIRTVCEPIFERPLKDISFGHLLVSLFRTARRFNMEVQPALVLLQKTLLNIEGLGRQLYPELDLWTTAHPFLERWLKQRFKPQALLQRLKYYGPEWLEQFPQVPQRLFHALERLGELPTDNRPLPATKPQGRRQRLAGAAILGIGLGIAFPQWVASIQHLPTTGLLLLGLGGLLLLVK